MHLPLKVHSIFVVKIAKSMAKDKPLEKPIGRLMQFIITQYPRLINTVPKRTRVSNVLGYGGREYDILLVMNNTHHTFVGFSTPLTEKLYGFYF